MLVVGVSCELQTIFRWSKIVFYNFFFFVLFVTGEFYISSLAALYSSRMSSRHERSRRTVDWRREVETPTLLQRGVPLPLTASITSCRRVADAAAAAAVAPPVAPHPFPRRRRGRGSGGKAGSVTVRTMVWGETPVHQRTERETWERERERRDETTKGTCKVLNKEGHGTGVTWARDIDEIEKEKEREREKASTITTPRTTRDRNTRVGYTWV